MDGSQWTCPAVGCEEVIGAGGFACEDHWYQLPRALRRQITEVAADEDLAPIVAAYADAQRVWSRVTA